MRKLTLLNLSEECRCGNGRHPLAVFITLPVTDMTGYLNGEFILDDEARRQLETLGLETGHFI